jgi:ankyrin repeat protein
VLIPEDSLLAEVAGFSVRYSGAAAGKHDIMKWLLENGADPEGRDRRGRTALALTEKMNDGTSVDLLLKAGARP